MPTAADDVIFNSSSGTGTCTIGANVVCRSLDTNGATTSTLKTFSQGIFSLTIGDATSGLNNKALDLSGITTYTLNSASNSPCTFVSTSATAQTIKFGGKSTGNTTFNGASGSWQILDTWTGGSGINITLTNGTLDTNGQTCAWDFFLLGVGTKTLTLGTSAITIRGTSGSPWNASTNGANFTINAGTSLITCSASASVIFAGNGKTYYDVAITGSGTWTMSGANTFHNLTRTSNVSGSQALVIQADIVINNQLTCTGSYTATNAVRIFIGVAQFAAANTTPRIITVNGSVSLTNVDFHYINAQGTAGTWTGTSIGDVGNNSGITFDSSRDLYWFGTANNWSTLNRWFTATGGGGTSATVPLPQDNAFIDANSGVLGGTFNTAMRVMGNNIDFTGVPNSPVWSVGAFNSGLMGSLTWGVGMTMTNSATGSIQFLGGGASVLTNNGMQYPTNFGVNIPISKLSGGSVTLADDLQLGLGQLSLNSNTFDANNKNVTCNSFASNASTTRVLNMGSGTWTLAGTGTIWTISGTGMTLNPNTSTIAITDTSAGNKTLAGFSLTYNNVTVTGGGTGSVTFSNNSTWNVMTLGAPKTYIFGINFTQTVNTLNAVGSAGNIITIQSTAANTQFNFSKASGIVSCDYLSLTDSNATGGASWYAGANSTNVSGNSGWVFTAPASGTPNLQMMGCG